jgi:hypothetical protein
MEHTMQSMLITRPLEMRRRAIMAARRRSRSASWVFEMGRFASSKLGHPFGTATMMSSRFVSSHRVLCGGFLEQQAPNVEMEVVKQS